MPVNISELKELKRILVEFYERPDIKEHKQEGIQKSDELLKFIDFVAGQRNHGELSNDHAKTLQDILNENPTLFSKTGEFNSTDHEGNNKLNKIRLKIEYISKKASQQIEGISALSNMNELKRALTTYLQKKKSSFKIPFLFPTTKKKHAAMQSIHDAIKKKSDNTLTEDEASNINTALKKLGKIRFKKSKNKKLLNILEKLTPLAKKHEGLKETILSLKDHIKNPKSSKSKWKPPSPS